MKYYLVYNGDDLACYIGKELDIDLVKLYVKYVASPNSRFISEISEMGFNAISDDVLTYYCKPKNMIKEISEYF